MQNYYEIDTRVRRQAEVLVNAGFAVDVFALRADIHPTKYYELNGVHVTTLSLSKNRGGKWRYIWEYIWFFLAASLFCSINMVKKRYQAVQVCTLPDFLVFAALVPKLMGAIIVLDMHEIMPEFYMSKYKVSRDHWIVRLLKWQERQCFRFSDKVITINDTVKELFVSRGLHPNKVTIVMNSADKSMFEMKKSVNFIPEKDNQYIMMYHGTLTNLYGLDIGIKSFSKALSEMENAEFWILGQGPEMNNLKILCANIGISHKVKFIGVVPQEQVVYWLAQCDVGVIPARRDQFLDLSFSTKLTEYMSMEKPVIMSRLKTIQKYFSEDAIAYFTSGDEEELSRRMIELYKDKELRLTIANCALEQLDKINWSLMKKRYLAVYQ